MVTVGMHKQILNKHTKHGFTQYAINIPRSKVFTPLKTKGKRGEHRGYLIEKQETKTNQLRKGREMVALILHGKITH